MTGHPVPPGEFTRPRPKSRLRALRKATRLSHVGRRPRIFRASFPTPKHHDAPMVAVVLGALMFWVCVFAVYFTAQGISPIEFFAGAYEAYDPELGQWRECAREASTGLVKEERFLLPDGRERASFLEHQVRHRDPATQAIAHVEPPRRIRRRRSRSIRP